MAQAGSSAMHHINPVEVTINGLKAFSVSVGNISSRFEKGGSEYELISNCRFLSRLAKVKDNEGGCWKMLSMDVIYQNDSISPVVPNGNPLEMDFPSLAGYRQSYKLLSWLLAEKGYTVKKDLPGVDDEQSVRNVMSRSLEWLNA